MIWQCGLQKRKMKAKTDTYSGLTDLLIYTIFFLLPRCSRRTSDNQELEGAARAGLEEKTNVV